MKDTTEKAESKAPEHAHVPAEHEPKAHASSEPLLKKTKSFGWLQAAIIAVPLALVGIFIVLSTFAATPHDLNVAKVKSIYLDPAMLGRPADSAGLTYWVGKMDNGWSEAAVRASLKGTAEYKKLHVAGKIADKSTADPSGTTQSTKNRLNAKSNEQCVVDAYKPVKPDAKGKAFWMARLASGKTCAETTTLIQAINKTNSKSSAKQSKTNDTVVSAEECKKILKKQFNNEHLYYFTPEKQAEFWLIDQYKHYQGYASGYNPGANTSGGAYAGDGLGAEGTELLNKILVCKITAKQAAEIVKNGDGTKKYAKEQQDDFEKGKLPVIRALRDLLKQAIASSGKNYTCWATNKAGKSVDMLTDPEFANTLPSYWCYSAMGMSLPKQVDEVFTSYRYGTGMSIDQIVAGVRGNAVGFCEEPSPDGLGGTFGSPIPACESGAGFYTEADREQTRMGQSASSNGTSSGSPTGTSLDAASSGRSSSPSYGASSGAMTNSR